MHKKLRERLRELVEKNGLLNCVQCGKCSSVCTMTEIFDDFAYSWSPRMVIEDALSERDLFRSPSVWRCLACDVCEHTCPSGVRFRDFIVSLRELAIEFGYSTNLPKCDRCGAPLLPKHTLDYVRGKTREHVPDSVLLCERCKRRIIIEQFKQNARASKKAVPIWRKDGRRRSKT